MVRTHTARAAARAIDRMGEPATIRNYTDTGTRDDYGDPDWDVTEVTTVAYFARPREQSEVVSTEGGEMVGSDSEIYIDDDITVNHSTSESESRASEVVRDRTGAEFRVLEVWDENNGIKKLMTERVDR